MSCTRSEIGRVTRDVLVYSDHGSNRFADKADADRAATMAQA
jgi:hypothetical protein